MRLRTFLCGFALAALFVVAAAAADVTGKWQAEFTTPNGQTRVTTFNFKVDGTKLTGTVGGQQGGDAEITDGKVSGADISFSVTRNFGGNEVKLLYKGKVADKEIQFSVQFGDREFQMTAKRLPT